MDPAEAITVLEVLAEKVKTIPGMVFGSSVAEQIEKLIHRAVSESTGAAQSGATGAVQPGTPQPGTAGMINASIPEIEPGIGLIVLLVQKNYFRHIDAVINEIKKIELEKKGIVRVSIEYALQSPEAWSIVEKRINGAVKKKTGARSVEITANANPELIGGFRLRMGDELIDSSVRSRLRQLQARLAGISDGVN